MMLRGSASAARRDGSSSVGSIVVLGGSAQNFLQSTLLHLRAKVMGVATRDQQACSPSAPSLRAIDSSNSHHHPIPIHSHQPTNIQLAHVIDAPLEASIAHHPPYA